MQEKIEDKIKSTLRATGFKCTPARINILSVFYSKKEPQDAEHIYKELKKEKKEIDEVTVYRTLSVFEKNGILKKVDLRKNSIHFELNSDHHHHIVCTNCNLIESFKDCDLDNFLEKIIKKSNNFKKIKEHSFELFGFCKKCSTIIN